MYFLYGEIFALMAVSFGVGAMLATLVTRTLVRRTEAQVTAEFIAKQKYYAAYDAQGLAAAGVRAKARHFLLQPLRHFYWRWIQLAGWRGGWHTLRLSLLMSYFELEKYRILANVTQQC